MELIKTLEVNKLITFYGKLLNDKQKSIVESYFYFNNSLSEIAEEFNITRQAVSDLINRVIKTLYNYEAKLGLVKKYDIIVSTIDKVSLSLDSSMKSKLEKIVEILEG